MLITQKVAKDRRLIVYFNLLVCTVLSNKIIGISPLISALAPKIKSTLLCILNK